MYCEIVDKRPSWR